MLNYLLTVPSCNGSPFPYDNDGPSVYIVLLHSILHAVPVAVGKSYSSVQKSHANTVTTRYRSLCAYPCDNFSIFEVNDLSVYHEVCTLIMYPVHTLFVHMHVLYMCFCTHSQVFEYTVQGQGTSLTDVIEYKD